MSVGFLFLLCDFGRKKLIGGTLFDGRIADVGFSLAAIDVNVNQPKPESEGGCQC